MWYFWPGVIDNVWIGSNAIHILRSKNFVKVRQLPNVIVMLYVYAEKDIFPDNICVRG